MNCPVCKKPIRMTQIEQNLVGFCYERNDDKVCRTYVRSFHDEELIEVSQWDDTTKKWERIYVKEIL